MRAALAITVLLMTAQTATAEVPRCWSSEHSSESIQDGIFRVFIPTPQTTAVEVATVMGILSRSLAGQVGVGAAENLEYIEIDVFGELKYWQPTVTFPTLESFKAAIVNSIAPVLDQNGVSIECAKINHHRPAPN